MQKNIYLATLINEKIKQISQSCQFVEQQFFKKFEKTFNPVVCNRDITVSVKIFIPYNAF
jgi:hypothetical protein